MLVANYKRKNVDDDDESNISSSDTTHGSLKGDEEKSSPEKPKSGKNIGPSPSLSSLPSVAPSVYSYQPLNDSPALKTEGQREVFNNPNASSLLAPMVGPQHPNRSASGTQNVFGGMLADDATDKNMFEVQMRAFMAEGQSLDPSGQYTITKLPQPSYPRGSSSKGSDSSTHAGSKRKGEAMDGVESHSSSEGDHHAHGDHSSESSKKTKKRKRGGNDDDKKSENDEEFSPSSDVGALVATSSEATSMSTPSSSSIVNQKRDKSTRDARNVESFLGSWADLSKRPKAPTRAEEEEARKKKEEEEGDDDGEDDGDGEEEGGKQKSKSKGSKGSKKAKLDEESVWHGSVADTTAALGHSWMKAPKQVENQWNSRIDPKEAAQVDKDLMKLLMANMGGEDEDGGSGSQGGRGESKSSHDGPSSSTKQHALHLTQKFSPAFQNFIPKKCIHTWSEAEKGVSSCRFIPKYGHLLLASSLDGNVRIYETSGKRRCMMTYKGHLQSIREIDWNPSGDRFLTASYDKTVRLWDAETGKTIGKFAGEAGGPLGGRHFGSSVPYCCKFYPLDPSIFLVGQSNRKIVQWDVRSNEVVQEYNRHLGAINSITFIDQNRRFVTSSDDKSVRVWDFDVPVDIKYIADPKMHSMPCIVMHPNGKYFLCSGLDNKIHVYSTREKFPANHKKRFTGHLVSGYACNLSVSPDGRCVTSGDSSGHIFFWDWKTCKLLKKLKAHSSTIVDSQWHPLESSRVASASWDGQLKIWD